MSYQNRGHDFVLYYPIFVWVKRHVNIMRSKRESYESFSEKLSNLFFSFAELPLIFHACCN